MSFGPAVRLRAERCAGCGSLIDAATCVGNDDPQAMPEPGDMTVCLYCGEIHTLGEDYHLRRATQDEIEADPESHELLSKLQQAIWEKAIQRATRIGE